MPSCNEEDINKFLNDYYLYDFLFYKSLSTNDHVWADRRSYHQSGLLVPRKYLSFFGAQGELPEKNTVYEIDIVWYYQGNECKRNDYRGNQEYATVRYYCEGNREDRPEAHLTNVYNPYFEELNSGALLVIGKIETDNNVEYRGIIIDDEDLLNKFLDVTDIPEGSLWGIIDIKDAMLMEDFDLVYEFFVLLDELAREIYEEEQDLPATSRTSGEIWRLTKDNDRYLRHHISCQGLSQSKTPFDTVLKNGPGNLARWLLQKAEFKLVRLLEKIHYPDIIIEKLRNRNQFYPGNWRELSRSVGNALEEIISISKSITQSRRSRAGNSFEWHIKYLLDYYEIEYERQAGGRKIDFQIIKNGDEVINLSAKTTLRERWKQVYEGSYFITLDRRITENKLDKIKDKNIKLVVPEEDISRIDLYKEEEYILSFKDFLKGIVS